MNTKKIRIFFKKNLTTIAVIAFLVFLFCISFGSSLLETWKLFSYKQDLIAQIAAKEEESKQLDEDIKQIGSQEYIERIARQYLELYYPNEQIVIPVDNTFVKEDNSQNQTPEQEQSQQTEEEQTARDQEVPTESEAIEEENPTQEEQTTEDIEEEQPQETETVQEEEQVTTDEE